MAGALHRISVENIAAADIHLTTEDLQVINQAFPLNVAKGEKYPAHLNFEN